MAHVDANKHNKPTAEQVLTAVISSNYYAVFKAMKLTFTKELKHQAQDYHHDTLVIDIVSDLHPIQLNYLAYYGTMALTVGTHKHSNPVTLQNYIDVINALLITASILYKIEC